MAGTLTTKPINLTQLQAEALALKAGHTFFSTGSTDPSIQVSSEGILPAGITLYCQDAHGLLTDPCPAGAEAYNAHVAAPNPLPALPVVTAGAGLGTGAPAPVIVAINSG